jgi:hypothetical protein
VSEPQYFWRCAHHPSSIVNFFDSRTECMWECHTQELKWYHGGVHPMPKSWPAVRAANDDHIGV